MTRFAFLAALFAFLARPAAAQTRRPDQMTFEIVQALRALEARVKALERRIK